MLRHPVPVAARFIDPLCGPASFKMEWSGTQMVRSRLRGFVHPAAQVGSRSSHASLHRCYARKRLQGVGSFVCQVVPSGNPRHVGVDMAKAKPKTTTTA